MFKAVAKYLGILCVGLGFVWATCALGRVGLDWGYYLIKAAIGQPAHDDQWWGAIFLFSVMFPAVSAGIVGGALTALFGGKYRWHLGLIGALITSSVIAFGPSNFDEWQVFAGMGGMILLYAVLAAPIAWFFRELTLRTNARKLMMAALPAMVLAAFIPVADLEKSWAIELPIYCELVALGGLLAAVALKAREYKTASAAAAVATFPMTAFNLVNIGFVLLNMVLIPSSRIGWHALTSALVISGVTVACSELGALLGWVCVRLRAR